MMLIGLRDADICHADTSPIDYAAMSYAASAFRHFSLMLATL